MANLNDTAGEPELIFLKDNNLVSEERLDEEAISVETVNGVSKYTYEDGTIVTLCGTTCPPTVTS
jgi:hypothetical protein